MSAGLRPATPDVTAATTLDVRGLTVEIDAEFGLVRAIDALDLTIARGETFALVGESGCGKSMTALALMRLLPEAGRVEHGRFIVGADEVFGLPEAAMRRIRGGRIGMIFQEPGTSPNPVLRVGEQIVEAIELHTPLRGSAARTRAIEWLGRVGIPEPERRIDEYPFRLSGGQKQRVMIAMTLACEPDFLIADEPTTALDVTIQKQILELLAQLQREQGMGMLLITHDLAVVSQVAHRVALMYAGQIVEVAEAGDFFAAPKHPYARLLLQALPDGARREGELAAIGGTVPPLWLRFEGCRFTPRCNRAFGPCPTTPPDLYPLDGGKRSVRCLLYTDLAKDAAPAAVQPTTEVPVIPSEAKDLSATLATEPLLDLRHLSVGFPIRSGLLHRITGEFKAVDDVSFTVRPGQTVALVGESGSGKTTIGKAIVQLLRGQATVRGEALFAGQDLFKLEGAELHRARRAVQIIFQDPFASLDPRMRVYAVLEEGLAALQPELAADERRARIEAMVEHVGLRRDALDRFPHEFSGGQRQRIAIARALAVGPRLVV